MNYYIQAQISNMKAVVKAFETSCQMAAAEDDGFVDKNEEKQLKRIRTACAKFLKELDAIQ